jgi:hypothetical protein
VESVPWLFSNTPVVVIVFYLSTMLRGPDVSNCICAVMQQNGLHARQYMQVRPSKNMASRFVGRDR